MSVYFDIYIYIFFYSSSEYIWNDWIQVRGGRLKDAWGYQFKSLDQLGTPGQAELKYKKMMMPKDM